MIEITLTQGQFAIIDDEDWELVKKYKWYAVQDKNTYYAYTHAFKNGIRTTIKMHRLIMNAKFGQLIDHSNSNGCDNRRNNLRLCSCSQNNQNQRKTRGSSSHKGVSLDKRFNRWQAYIGINNKKIHLGSFGSEEEAAKAYDSKAKELFGEFAQLNFGD